MSWEQGLGSHSCANTHKHSSWKFSYPACLFYKCTHLLLQWDNFRVSKNRFLWLRLCSNGVLKASLKSFEDLFSFGPFHMRSPCVNDVAKHRVDLRSQAVNVSIETSVFPLGGSRWWRVTAVDANAQDTDGRCKLTEVGFFPDLELWAF